MAWLKGSSVSSRLRLLPVAAAITRPPSYLMHVLLQIRSMFMFELERTPAELVYGISSRFPGNFLPATTYPASSPFYYVQDLREFFIHLRSTPPLASSARAVFVSQDLTACTHPLV